MTFFGIIWCIIIIWAFFNKNIKYMYFFTLLFMTFQCSNVIFTDSIKIGPQALTSLAFIIKTFLYNKGKLYFNRIHNKYIFAALFLLLTVLISCIHNAIFIDKVLYIIQLSIYIFCFISILISKDGISNKSLYKMIRYIVIFLLIMGIVQLLTTSNILPLKRILQILIYNDMSTTLLFNNVKGIRRIASTFMEPSYFAGLLVGAFYYLLLQEPLLKRNYLLLIAIFMEIILTFSSTAYVAFAILGILFLFMQNRTSYSLKFFLIVVAILCFILFYLGFYHVLDAVIFSKQDTGSFHTRSRLNMIAIDNFYSSQLFGVGYKNSRGSSIINSLLGQIGILGFSAYILFNFVFILYIFKNRKNNIEYDNFDIGLRFSVLSVMICQFIACPDLDLCTYWFWIYAMGMSIKDFHKSKQCQNNDDTDILKQIILNKIPQKTL